MNDSSPSKPGTQLRVFSDLEALSQAAADFMVETAREAARNRGRFTLALSGGSTPKRLYELLGTSYCYQMPWSETHLFWGDERCVPKFHDDSNYATAYEQMLWRIPINSGSVHRIPTEVTPPGEAAFAYERRLRVFFNHEDPPLFDLVLLGLGEDGHTASIFPEDLAEHDLGRGDGLPPRGRNEQWVGDVSAPERHSPRWRITLTLHVLNQARRVLFLVSGERKRETLGKILRGTPESFHFPAAHIRPNNQLSWYVDEAAYGSSGP